MRRGEVTAPSTACSVVAAVLGLLFAPPIVAQVTVFGPLTSEEGGPLQRISYTPVTERAVTLAPGVLSTDVWLGLSNIFEQDSADTHDLLMDMERLLSTTTVRYGVIEGLEIGGRLTFETTGGGVLDSFISGWHTKFSLGNANRERYASDEFDQRLKSAHNVVLLDAGQRTFVLEDMALRQVGSGSNRGPQEPAKLASCDSNPDPSRPHRPGAHRLFPIGPGPDVFRDMVLARHGGCINRACFFRTRGCDARSGRVLDGRRRAGAQRVCGGSHPVLCGDTCDEGLQGPRTGPSPH